MKKRILFLLVALSMALMLCLSANAMDGSGTESDPYIVKTAEDFVSIKSNLSAHYRLANEIEVSSTTGAIVEGTFSGVFDGNGKTITVTIDAPTSPTGDTFDALFGVVSGKIKNLTVKGSATGSNKVAGIVGKLTGNGNVDHCVSYVTVTGRKNIGGIVGLLINNATITNCINYGEIKSLNPIQNGVDIGGIVGCVWEASSSVTTISSCYNAGDINAQGFNCGGICGYFYGGSAENCFNTGRVTSTAQPSNAGAIYGRTENKRNYTVNGYFSSLDIALVGDQAGNVNLSNCMLESTGVAIYLGSGSGIRGEFHLNEAILENLLEILGGSLTNVEYGAVVSTKATVKEIGGDLTSTQASETGRVVFAPAIKNGVKQYFFTDSSHGEGYHSYRYALTNFPDTKESYNTEFVILGYVKVADDNVIYLNTVKSDRLASSVDNTGFNAVNIVRVAEATIEDGDFVGNADALSVLDRIVSLKEYGNSIDIDGSVGYGHANATFTTNISSEDTVVFKISNTNEVEFADYIRDLIADGYEKVSENEINGIPFYVLKKGNALINATYVDSLNQATVSSETVTALPESLEKPTYTKKNESSITQIKLKDDGNVKEGMSYVIHLEDGTFFIIDGGWCENDAKEADKLYDTLVSLSGEGNDIVIAGWIFTHCHGDHIATFNLFIEKYHDKVTVNQLLYNFPADADIKASASAYMMDSSKQRYPFFREMIATYLPDVEFVKIHSGYKFYYANAEIEIIQTLEDLYPQTVANYDFNSSSTIFAVTVSGQRMMFLGDVSDTGASRLNSLFGASLKSDFMQIAHHGLNNGGTIRELYQYIGAEYILYPAPLSWYRQNLTQNANDYISNQSTDVKQIFVSGIETFTLALPYDGTAFDGEKLPQPDSVTEAERPEGVVVPDAYFDLSFENGVATDAMGNATVEVTGGAIKETTVEHDSQSKTVTAFTKGESGNYYMTLNFDGITTDEQWGEFVMGSTTFEIFIKFDALPGATVGLITSCNGGGTTLYLRRQAGGQLNFQIGSTKPNAYSDNSNYSSAAPMGGTEPVLEAGTLLHLVGSYDSETNMMRLYINGILVSEANYGEGEFRGGAGNDYVIGIGYNPQYPGEVISQYTTYELYEARIYNTALTNEQVAQQYWNCIDNLLITEAGNE